MKDIFNMPNIMLVLFFASLSMYAQIKDTSSTNSIQKMEKKIVVGSSNAFMEFQKGTFLRKDSIPLFLKSKLRMSSKDEIRYKKSELDEIGFEHIRYQHYYDGFLVEGSEYIAHLKNSELISANGKLCDKVIIKPNFKKKSPKINLGVLKEAGITLEDYVKAIPEIIVLPVEIKDSVIYKLCHKYSLLGDLESQNIFAYIDIETGEVIKTISKIQNCNVGTVNTLYNGSQSISTSLSGSNYILNANCNNRKIRVTSTTGVEYSDSDNIWNSTENGIRTGATVFWGLQKSYDYFLSVHNRNSYNNAGAQINGIIYNSTLPDAFWNGFNAFYFEDGDNITYNAIASIDVIGHEYTHAITQFTAGLNYEKESGALNESFSDIFGTTIEFYAQNGVGDYDEGEDFYIDPNGKIRSLSDPKSKWQPDTYKGVNWSSIIGCIPAKENDYCGVHKNSGVQNHWFYILSEGKTGINDNGIGYNVVGIGRDKAALIAFRNLAFYLTSSSGYREAMMGSIRAAKDLYGSCSLEAQQTAKAWEAVGVILFPFSELNASTLSLSDNRDAKKYIIVYHANNTITSTQNLASGADVVYTAGNQIRLQPGFRANQGSRLRIYNSGCHYDVARKENQLLADSSKVKPVDNLDNFSIYPNPANSEITIKSDGKEMQQVSIVNLFGVSVYQSELTSTSQNINISGLLEGVYFVTVTMDKKRQTKKLLVNK